MDAKILIVDDEPDIRDVLAMALGDMGFRVLSAADGHQALEIFQKEHPPIVVTDIKMPGMDGIELLERLKRENRETEVIMVTGHGDMDLAIRSLKNEATDFIAKPINIDVLEIALKRATERIVTRRQLKAYTERLEALLEEKTMLQNRLASLGLMVGSISHGIKGLLTGLDGGIYLVESGLKRKDAEMLEEGWQAVKVTVGRIRKLMQDILYSTRERSLQKERLAINAFARDAAASFKETAKENGIEFILEPDPSDGRFEADAPYLQAALANLLENALDACLRDGEKSDHRIVFRASSTADAAVFEVIDNGCGMAPETRDKLFDLFFSSKGSEGTGLGLFVTQKIVEQHGGRIDVRTTPGHGSQFTVSLPGESAATPPSDAGSRQTPKR